MPARLDYPFCLLAALVDPFAEVSCRAVQAVWDRWLGPHRFERRLERFIELGWIERPSSAVPRMDRILRLTDRGRIVALGGRDPERQWRRAWDGRWRIVAYDVPEVSFALRMRLWRRLRVLGFGYFQRSIWLSPDPMEELRRLTVGVAATPATLAFLEARPCGGETDEEIVASSWDFAGINRRYDHYLDHLDAKPRRLAGRSRRRWLAVEHRAWRHAVDADPLLPESLLPPVYRGREAHARRREMLREIAAIG